MEQGASKLEDRQLPGHEVGAQLLRHQRRGSLLWRIRRYLLHNLDSNYMSDVWTFHTITMEWTEI